MKRWNPVLLILLATPLSSLGVTGPYTSEILQIQVADIGNPFNTVHLKGNISDSPCESTNVYNRFEVKNNIQQSAVLAAFMAGMAITIYGSGSCNQAGIETILDIRLKAQ